MFTKCSALAKYLTAMLSRIEKKKNAQSETLVLGLVNSKVLGMMCSTPGNNAFFLQRLALNTVRLLLQNGQGNLSL